MHKLQQVKLKNRGCNDTLFRSEKTTELELEYVDGASP